MSHTWQKETACQGYTVKILKCSNVQVVFFVFWEKRLQRAATINLNITNYHYYHNLFTRWIYCTKLFFKHYHELCAAFFFLPNFLILVTSKGVLANFKNSPPEEFYWIGILEIYRQLLHWYVTSVKLEHVRWITLCILQKHF